MKNNNTWEGKSVWLTGASSGIGKALTYKLADLGAKVVVSARREDVLNNMALQKPQHIIPLAVDLTDKTNRQAITDALAERVESLDVVIIAAGAVEYEDDLSFDLDRYQSIFDVNFFGLVNSVAMAMPLLKKSSNKPYIVGVTSLTVVTGFPRAEIYGASKAAADYFLKALRMDLPKKSFDISIIRPGFVKTPMTSVNDFPMPFIISAEEAADRIVSAMNKKTFIVNFPRRFYWLLSLFTCVPSFWYKVIAPKLNRQEKK